MERGLHKGPRERVYAPALRREPRQAKDGQTTGADATSKSQINLTWADNSSDETGFRVERSTDGVTFAQVATVGAGVKSFASTGLSGGKKYFFRVMAYNANGNSASTAVVNATTPTK